MIYVVLALASTLVLILGLVVLLFVAVCCNETLDNCDFTQSPPETFDFWKDRIPLNLDDFVKEDGDE